MKNRFINILTKYGYLACVLCLLQFSLIAHAQSRTEFDRGVFSTLDNEYGITFSEQMGEVYFTRAKGKWAKEKLTSLIYYSQKVHGKWITPRPVSISGKYNDGEPHLTRDGKSLFFVSDRPDKSGKQSDDIWISNRLPNGGWGEPVNLGPKVNSNGNEGSPRTTANGDLYFVSDREGGFGQGDIYYSKVVNGGFSEAKNLGGVINSAKGEWNLEISHDGSILIFEASERRENLSSFGDLYISFKNKGQWSIPQNIIEVNTPGSDLYPYLSPDGKMLIYSSTVSREHIPANFYQIEFAGLKRKYLAKAVFPLDSSKE